MLMEAFSIYIKISIAFHLQINASCRKITDIAFIFIYYKLINNKREMIQLKVEIKISADVDEPYAVIYTNKITSEIQRLTSAFELDKSIITAMDNERIVILQPNEIYMIRIENEQAVLYCNKKKYCSGRRLYDFESQLGKDFMRISKSTLINLEKIDSVEPSFNGMMCLMLKNGCKDYISRKYLPGFKKYLGI